MAAFLNLINETAPTGTNGNAVIILLIIKQFDFKLKILPNIHFNISSGNSFAHHCWTL